MLIIYIEDSDGLGDYVGIKFKYWKIKFELESVGISVSGLIWFG